MPAFAIIYQAPVVQKDAIQWIILPDAYPLDSDLSAG